MIDEPNRVKSGYLYVAHINVLLGHRGGSEAKQKHVKTTSIGTRGWVFEIESFTSLWG